MLAVRLLLGSQPLGRWAPKWRRFYGLYRYLGAPAQGRVPDDPRGGGLLKLLVRPPPDLSNREFPSMLFRSMLFSYMPRVLRHVRTQWAAVLLYPVRFFSVAIQAGGGAKRLFTCPAVHRLEHKVRDTLQWSLQLRYPPPVRRVPAS